MASLNVVPAVLHPKVLFMISYKTKNRFVPVLTSWTVCPVVYALHFWVNLLCSNIPDVCVFVVDPDAVQGAWVSYLNKFSHMQKNSTNTKSVYLILFSPSGRIDVLNFPKLPQCPTCTPENLWWYYLYRHSSGTFHVCLQ